jgi:hypothetical protein
MLNVSISVLYTCVRALSGLSTLTTQSGQSVYYCQDSRYITVRIVYCTLTTQSGYSIYYCQDSRYITVRIIYYCQGSQYITAGKPYACQCQDSSYVNIKLVNLVAQSLTNLSIFL